MDSAVRLFEDPVKRRSTHSVRIGRVSNGTLVGFGGRFYRDNPEEGLVNRDNLGYVPMDLIMWRVMMVGTPGKGRVRSSRLWSARRSRFVIRSASCARPLAGTDFHVERLGWSDAEWYECRGLVSHDRGRTWPEFIRVMGAYDQGIIHWEQSLVELSDGRLLSVAWAVQEGTGKTLPTPYAISQDGRSFDPPRPTGLRGQTAKNHFPEGWPDTLPLPARRQAGPVGQPFADRR